MKNFFNKNWIFLIFLFCLSKLISPRILTSFQRENSLVPFFGRQIGIKSILPDTFSGTRYIIPNIDDCGRWMQVQSDSKLCGLITVQKSRVQNVQFILLDRGNYQCLRVIDSNFYFALQITGAGCQNNLNQCSRLTLLYLPTTNDCQDDDGSTYFSRLRIKYTNGGYTISFFAKPEFNVGYQPIKPQPNPEPTIDLRIKIFHYSTISDSDASDDPSIYYKFRFFNSIYSIASQCFSVVASGSNYPIGTKLSIKQVNSSPNADMDFFLFRGPSINGFGSFVVRRNEYEIPTDIEISTFFNTLVVKEQITNQRTKRKSYRLGWYISSTKQNNVNIFETEPVVLNSDNSFMSQCAEYRDVLTLEEVSAGVFYLYNFCNEDNYKSSAPLSDSLNEESFRLGFPDESSITNFKELQIMKNRSILTNKQKFYVYVDLSEANQ